jgi:hypothetical protein
MTFELGCFAGAAVDISGNLVSQVASAVEMLSDINSPHLSVVFPHALFYHIILI